MEIVIWSHVFMAAFYILYFAVIITTVFVVILDNRNPVKTMAWILVLFFLPVAGLVFYLFFGRSTRREHLISRKGYARLTKRPMAEYQTQVSLHAPIEKQTLMNFFSHVNGALPFGGNRTTVYIDGASMLADLIKELYRAKHHIHVEFYIFEDDAVGRLVRDVLIDKAREGVKVRVLHDDVGCWKVSHAFYEQMLCEGIEVMSFLKVRFPQFTGKVNYRNHRKIVVIDGKVGFVGGMNLAERYVKGVPWGVWRDTHAKLEGKVVYGLQTAFLTDWYAMDRTLFTSAEYFPKTDVRGNVVAQIVTSDPVGEWRDIMQGLMMAICSARRYFYVQTPYFLPDEEVKTALQTAALAGVDVRIMLPKKADTWLIHKASLSYLAEMMKAGVKIYLYRKGFIHSKLMVSDDEFSTIGSTNMDFRSFEHNFEANAFFYDKDTASALKEIFLADQRDCMLLSLKVWDKRSWKSKVTESVVRLLSPLL
ncbi:cardiolipin synthase [Bacteroides gallinaceum]|uniref:Cardiolipin synthase n=2 Tax=Bacteroidaceae TaxID=815 RepID=A0ABT7VF93_9BACE|nr:cardiolipin synthase [Bacteroides gallinaceum]MBU3857418.1 cardiolipin synthase [Candidatus Phocaeicola excrementipullorum]MDM8324963.1 cardiolipin synthase [Bacteroides gallinaceum]